MKKLSAFVVFGALVMGALGACSSEDEEQMVFTNKDKAGAEGEVLKGSISDAMIPLDEITSESPKAAVTGAADGSDEDGDQSGTEASTQGAAASAPSNPAPSNPAPSSAPDTALDGPPDTGSNTGSPAQ